MSDNRLDELYEAESAALWEKHEECDPAKEALAIAIDAAVKLLNSARDTLCAAIDEDFSGFDRVTAFANDIEDLAIDLREEKKGMTA